MLKDTNKYETSSHFSYNEYKRKTKKGPNKDVLVFVSVFVVALLVILGFAKILSPDVDVAISVNNETTISEDSDNESLSSAIDERLRKLKMEDEGKKEGEEEMFSPELDEKVVLPHQKRKTVGEIEAEKSDIKQLTVNDLNNAQDNNKQPEHHEAAPKPVQKPVTVSMPEQIVNAKVVVGYYASEKQAEVAKSIIQDAGLGVTPLVKNLNGYYTLQVGSYSSREKAQQAANSLLKSNFPARVIVE